jgi:urate oxidase
MLRSLGMRLSAASPAFARAAVAARPRLAAATAFTTSAAAVVAAAASMSIATATAAECKSNPDGLTQQRTQDFPLTEHFHGKTRVRVLRVRREEGKDDTVQEYNVQTKLFSPMYNKVFTEEDNDGLVATDTQKNTVYAIAKRSKATTPEGYGIDLARHLLSEYPVLTAVEVEVTEDLWRRVVGADGPHEHGFVREAPERAYTCVRVTRESPHKPEVVSGLTGLTVLKTTQSGFSNYLRDKYTMLAETTERCMATEMKVEWKCVPDADPSKTDYGAIRSALREQLIRGYFGPAKGGIFSHSLQATVYDMGCLVLKEVPLVQSVSIYTPNIHMIPAHSLKNFGDGFSDDVYVATSEPAGTIYCTVSR